jgi:Zn ribbon nucleic-acid-binding protein
MTKKTKCPNCKSKETKLWSDGELTCFACLRHYHNDLKVSEKCFVVNKKDMILNP